MNAQEINTTAKELVERHNEGKSFKNKKEGAGWSQGAWVGVGYDRENEVDVRDINKIVKRAVKIAHPDVKLSARKDHGGYHHAITVEILECDTHIRECKYTEQDKADNQPPHAREYTEKGKAVTDLIENVLAYFNKDNCDSMTDYFEVGFYSNVTYSSNLGKEIIV